METERQKVVPFYCLRYPDMRLLINGIMKEEIPQTNKLRGL
jgi:hypothetical protein